LRRTQLTDQAPFHQGGIPAILVTWRGASEDNWPDDIAHRVEPYRLGVTGRMHSPPQRAVHQPPEHQTAAASGSRGLAAVGPLASSPKTIIMTVEYRDRACGSEKPLTAFSRTPDGAGQTGLHRSTRKIALDQTQTVPTALGLDALSSVAVRDEVAIEDFEEGSLALLCEQLRLVQLNPTARDVLGRLDGERTVGQVVEEVAAAYGQPFQRVLADLLELLANLEAQGVVERR
jgi:pyrroloquinoline quinone biosynthesis protein D